MARTPGRRKAAPARWALQDAKNRLSEVVDAALRGQPQVVTRRGIEAAVIISHDDWIRMTATHNEQRRPLATYLVDVPRADRADDELFERIELRPRRN